MKYKTLSQINASIELQVSIIAYTSLTLSLSKLFHVIMKNERIYLNLEFTPAVKKSCITSFFLNNHRGSSKVYKMIRRKYMHDNNIPIAPAYITAQRDYGVNMDLKRWEQNLNYTPKIIALAGSSAFYYKVQIRQNWSREKNVKTAQNADLSFCLYCEDESLSNSHHMFVSCVMA